MATMLERTENKSPANQVCPRCAGENVQQEFMGWVWLNGSRAGTRPAGDWNQPMAGHYYCADCDDLLDFVIDVIEADSEGDDEIDLTKESVRSWDNHFDCPACLGGNVEDCPLLDENQ